MKHIALALPLLFVACQEKKSKPTDPPPAPTRADVCAGALSSFDRYVDTGNPDASPDAILKVKAALADRCIQDQWSDPALACMRVAKSSHDTFQCWNEQLTKEQREAAGKALGSLKM